MNPKPTKNEILEKYRDVIDADDFDILYADQLPTPKQTHRENASLQYLGTLNGWYVWAKCQFGRVVTVIIFIGGIVSGLEAINKYGHIGYDQVAQYIQLGSEHKDTPATEYVLLKTPDNWPLPPDQPIRFTMTTTTTPPPQSPSEIPEIPPGSGIAPSSGNWYT
ncbi:MAG: hypothetical protein O2955_20010 [Planctomycetota bacterium]|nr:hypothetical protein [Planctomycetota bacterium]MDA1214799.1 hypothetical protein [Planctomycetota bacterium]